MINGDFVFVFVFCWVMSKFAMAFVNLGICNLTNLGIWCAMMCS